MVSDKKKCSLAFGLVMTKAREKKGLQQWEVAEQLGISQPYYCYLEKGQRVIDLDLALKVCKLLGIDLNDFVRTYK